MPSVHKRFYVFIDYSQCLFLSQAFTSFISEKIMNFNDSHRDHLNAIYRAALSAVNGKHCVAQYLRDNQMEGEIYLLAIGKAATAMAKGALEILGDRIIEGLIVTRSGDEALDMRNIKLVEAGHPVPDERSISAGHQLIKFINTIPEKAKILCLISGGTSSLVEVLPDSVTLDQLAELNKWLLESGLPITEMNAIRKRVSLIKGGRLAMMLKEQDVKGLLISDVQGDNPSDIGSGLFFPPTKKDLSIDPDDYPGKFTQLMRSAIPMPDPDASCFHRIHYSIVASLEMAIEAARQTALTKGYDVAVHQEYLQGDAIEAGKYIAGELKKTPGKLHLWGGECTVSLPEDHGTGGRCQSLALSAALEMGGQSSWCLLAAGTDGSDGSENVAGVCVDNGTLERAGHAFADSNAAIDCLRRADAGSFFRQTNDLVITGPTGTNVTDVVMGYSN